LREQAEGREGISPGPTEPPRPTEPIPNRQAEILPHLPGRRPRSTAYRRLDRTFSELRTEQSVARPSPGDAPRGSESHRSAATIFANPGPPCESAACPPGSAGGARRPAICGGRRRTRLRDAHDHFYGHGAHHVCLRSVASPVDITTDNRRAPYGMPVDVLRAPNRPVSARRSYDFLGRSRIDRPDRHQRRRPARTARLLRP